MQFFFLPVVEYLFLVLTKVKDLISSTTGESKLNIK